MSTSPAPLQDRDTNTTTPAQDKDTTDLAQHSEKDSPKSRAKQTKAAKAAAKIHKSADLADIHLEGEEDEKVPIYETCDAIRRKIREILKKTTQAQSELLPHSKVVPRGIARFLNLSGSRSGAQTEVFYAAYVYFEKIRIKEGKKKTPKREEMEKKWGRRQEFSAHSMDKEWVEGFPRVNGNNMRMSFMEGQNWTLNSMAKPMSLGTEYL